jgi:methylenetetrahydrofolate reductase (NADPH)
MKVTEKLKSATRPLFSFEVIPPLKGNGVQALYEAIDPLMKFNPSFINVTYHREEYVYKRREKGYLEKISIRKRPGTVSICAALQNRYGVETVPHLICGGFTKEETENALLDLDFLGIDNVLALRGDPVKTEPHFVPTPGGHAYATDLVKQICELNEGKYLDDEIQDAHPTNFCIGVAGYPEKHFESPNKSLDLHYLKQKVDAGAEYIVTQLFFDNKTYLDFFQQCRDAGIEVPIIPGIKPITQLRHLTFMPKFFHVDLPEALTKDLMNCKTDKEVSEVGVRWTIKQCEELLDAGAPCIHFFTMGKSTAVKQIVESLYRYND